MRETVRLVLITSMASACLVFCLQPAEAQVQWVETTQEDFRDGIYERNIYASHRGGGAVEFAPRFDLNNDGYIDLFTGNTGAPYVLVYWGSGAGYSAGNRTDYPNPGAGNCDAADLDCDGYTELLTSIRYGYGLKIFWGSPSGPDPLDSTLIPLSGNSEACFIADPNKDGYLDIAASLCSNGIAHVFWGSSVGYDPANRTDLPLEAGAHNIEVADLNIDGWADIVFVNEPSSGPCDNYIYWGSASGFSGGNRTLLEGPGGPHGLSVADLDGNGYLDLIFTAWYDSRAYIYWGDTAGYSPSNRQVLNPTACYGGSTVADINEDSYLDIVFHHGGGGSRQQKIYWGSASGYSDANSTDIGIACEFTGGFVADLDYDGALDIFANVCVPSGTSYVFWGPGFSTHTGLPSHYDHHGMFREIGNVYDRSYEESYVSSVFDAGDVVDWGVISWVDSLPPGSDIVIRVRSGDTPSPDPSWSSWVEVSNGQPIPESLNARYLQYEALLSYTNPAYLPVLFEIQVTYLVGIEEESRVEPSASSSSVLSAFPNPFTRFTTISFRLASEVRPAVRIRDISGRLVWSLRSDSGELGSHTIVWDGRDSLGREVASGLYFCCLEAASDFAIQKIALVR